MKTNAIFSSVRVGLMIIAICGLASTGKAQSSAGKTEQGNTDPRENQTVDLGDGVTMEFVLIHPGTFQMGTDKVNEANKDNPEQRPMHKVTIIKPFYLGKYLVTQEQWERVMGSNPSYFKGARNPVETVTWDDCQDFMAKLKEKVPGKTFRLPTEAEWEYACRAGTTTDYNIGDSDAALGDYAWFRSNGTHPVGEKKPNAWGLYDMLGNVNEWCSDWYGFYKSGDQTDPVGPPSGSYHVLRSGHWGCFPVHLQSAFRNSYISEPYQGSYGDGLRCVLVVGTSRR